MRTIPIFITVLLLTAAGPGAQVTDMSDADVREIIQTIDELYRSETSYSEFEMEIVTPHWQRTLVMKAWSQGMDKTFIRIESPKKDKGVATLRIENEMWNYLPKTNKVIKIPPSMMMSSWMGSDFTNDDLVKEFSLFEDYSYELIEMEGDRDDLVYVNCIPREDLPVVWGNIVIAAQEKDYIPVWQKFYDEEGQLMRVWVYSDVRQFGGRAIPAAMEMLPQTKEGHKTVIRYTKLEFDVGVGDEVFSLRNLRSGD
ncbi:MAG: outer membrane lipoprotein-sorting protein [Candidatus Zixiibacteriota bacterium]|nr:MAG: outer membrane lipoprotein-sorting protein [candidate division Zixibacteria bacterium]